MKSKFVKNIPIGEALVSKPHKAIDNRDNIASYSIEEDDASFLPIISISEIKNCSYINNSIEYSVAKITIRDTYKIADAYKMYVYISSNSENKDYLVDEPSKVIDIIKDIHSYSRDVPVVIPGASSINYSTYAIFIDRDNNIIKNNGKPIIISSDSVIFYGLVIKSDIYGSPDFSIVDNNAPPDIEDVGFTSTYIIKSDTINVTAFNLKSIHDKTEWDTVFNTFKFKNTFNDYASISFDVINTLEYYVLYQFTSDYGFPPAIKYPQELDWSISKEPRIKDTNGVWSYVGNYDSPDISITLPESGQTAYWLGFRIGVKA